MTPDRPRFAVTRNLRLLYALGVCTMAQPGLAIWVIYLLDFRHLTLPQVGMMEAFYWGVKLLLEMPSGAFADRFGRRATFAVGLVIEGAGVTTFAFASNFTILLISYVLWSMGFSFRSVRAASVLGRQGRLRRRRPRGCPRSGPAPRSAGQDRRTPGPRRRPRRPRRTSWPVVPR